MNDVIRDFVEVREISNPMSESGHDLFLVRMGRKRYSNDAVKGEDGIIVNANAQVITGAEILEENKVGI